MREQPSADQGIEFDTVGDEWVTDGVVPFVSLLDEWPDIVGALILRGLNLIERTEEPERVVDLTVVGGQIGLWSSPPNSVSQPVWVSDDAQMVLYPEGPGRSNRGVWSFVSRDDTFLVAPKRGVLWSVSHVRRNVSRLDSGAPDQYTEYVFAPGIERVFGRLEQGFLVLYDGDSASRGLAVWTDQGAIVPIDIPIGAELLHLGPSSVLLRASKQGVRLMDVSELNAVTISTAVNVDFEILNACLSPDEMFVALMSQEGLSVVEVATGLTLIHEPLVDDFTWITSDYLVFTRGDSLFASDLVSNSRQIAKLFPDYSWGVASSGSACQPAPIQFR